LAAVPAPERKAATISENLNRRISNITHLVDNFSLSHGGTVPSMAAAAVGRFSRWRIRQGVKTPVRAAYSHKKVPPVDSAATWP
jgi:hypothetical protein